MFLGKSNLAAPRICVQRNLLEVYYLTSTIRWKVELSRRGMMWAWPIWLRFIQLLWNPLGTNLTNGIKAFNHVCIKI